MKKMWHSLLALIALCVFIVPTVYAQELGTSAVDFPYTGNRTAVWVVAQLHILFAAFILGAPIFVVIAEWLGYRKQDPRYDRMAREMTKVTVILFSMTAVTGGFIHFYPSGGLSSVHNLVHQSILRRLRDPLSCAVHHRDHPHVCLSLYLGCLEGRKEGATHRGGHRLESRLSAHSLCDQWPHVVHEHSAKGRGDLASRVPRGGDLCGIKLRIKAGSLSVCIGSTAISRSVGLLPV
ncbi:MAG: cytochrome ubiquinol oxidase subunit I [Nitrospira sp.]|nr:cytochrome ubiquinol oxidase subunit I [Nitrospira sp.]